MRSGSAVEASAHGPRQRFRIKTAVVTAVFLLSVFLAVAWRLPVLLAGGPIVIVPEILSFETRHNFDWAFSLSLPDWAGYLLTGGVLVAAWRSRKILRLEWNVYVSGLVLIASGGLANLLERLIRGSVIDYLAVRAFGLSGWWNIADLAIVSGIGVWAVFLMRGEKEKYAD